jgi:hypothetical protein
MRTELFLALVLVTGIAGTAKGGRTITVAQSGKADVIGSDNMALQKAADLLKPGDTLAVGAGTYAMENSLFIPSDVTVQGEPGKTILRKGTGVVSPLEEDGDYGETLLVVKEPEKLHPGMGLSILDDKQNSGWDISVSSIVNVEGHTVRINPMTLRDYDHEQAHARVQNTFPILCVEDGKNVVLEGITVDGNKQENAYVDGCRGGAIYLYCATNVVIRNCVARNYNGDGISFQITDRVKVLDSESCGHTGYGVHPGTGSPNATVEHCRIHDNGQVGLFLCWRVRHGTFANNVIENNGQYGISIGHKDTDNMFTNNTVARNGFCGVYFRQESPENSGHRNTFRANTVVDNGNAKRGYGFYVEPHAGEIVIENNRIAETRGDKKTQRVGVYKVKGAGSVHVRDSTTAGQAGGDYAEGEPQQQE